jgi:hypothetical protein
MASISIVREAEQLKASYQLVLELLECRWGPLRTLIDEINRKTRRNVKVTAEVTFLNEGILRSHDAAFQEFGPQLQSAIKACGPTSTEYENCLLEYTKIQKEYPNFRMYALLLENQEIIPQTQALVAASASPSSKGGDLSTNDRGFLRSMKINPGETAEGIK